MGCLDHRDFCVSAGETFLPTIRWGTETLTSKPITAISKAAPVAITATAHGAPDGWPVAVVSAQGMIQINATRYPPAGKDWHPATAVTVNSITINDISSADYSTYTSGGFLVYRTPMSLVGMTARMRIYDAPVDGTLLMTLTSPSGITISTANYTIIPRIETAALDWTTGYYDLEMTDVSGTVVQLLSGIITIE